jgi:hypothetical protein
MTHTLSVYHDTRGPGTCRSCGAAIEWAQLVTGKRIPFDPPVVVRVTQTALVDERTIDVVDMDFTRSHFASCPDAKDWRRR